VTRDPVSLSEALEDPGLFAPLFTGRSWRRWKAFIAALFGELMSDEALRLYRHHTAREGLPATSFREAALICGRRGGKSRILALIAIYLACFRDYTPFLAPGETAVVAVIAQNRAQSRVLLRYIIGLLRAVPLLEELIVDELAETVRLSNGVVIEIHTASIASPRGRTFVAVLCDELAFWPATADASNPDAEVVASVRPGLASIPNSLLLMASSPYWQKGVLFNTFRRHWGQDGARVLVWRGTTLEMNDTIDPAVIAEAYEEDPVSAAAEYGAEFRTDVDNYISRAVVEAAVMRGVHELPPATDLTYRAFVDASSGSGADRMVLAIAHDAGGIATLDCLRGWSPPFSPDQVVEEMVEILKVYRISKVVGDRWGLGWVGERFEVRGLVYEVSDPAKSDIYRELLGPLNSGSVRLLDHPPMVAELLNLERRVARGGHDSIDHPRGLHDDYVNAAAGVLVLVAGRPRLAGWNVLEVYRRRYEELQAARQATEEIVAAHRSTHPDEAIPQEAFELAKTNWAIGSTQHTALLASGWHPPVATVPDRDPVVRCPCGSGSPASACRVCSRFRRHATRIGF